MERRSYDWSTIRSFYEAGNSPMACRTRFHITNGAWYDAVNRGKVKLREVGVAKPPGHTRQAVAALLAEGLSQAEIATRLGVSRPTVCFHMRKLGIPARTEFTNHYDWDGIRTYYERGHSAGECQRRFGFSRDAWADAIHRGVIQPRPRAEPVDVVFAAGRRRSRHHLKLRLVSGGLKPNYCEECGLTDWRGMPISLQLHHINGDGCDNRLENLRLLCPNCHSQTDTWGGRNKTRNAIA